MNLKAVFRRQLNSIDQAGMEAVLIALYRLRRSETGTETDPDPVELTAWTHGAQVVQRQLDSLLSFLDPQQLESVFSTLIGMRGLFVRPPDDQADIEAITDLVQATLILIRRVAGWRPYFEENDRPALITAIHICKRLQLISSPLADRWSNSLERGARPPVDPQHTVAKEGEPPLHPGVQCLLKQLSERAREAAPQPAKQLYGRAPGRGRRLLMSIAEAIASYNCWVSRYDPPSEQADAQAGQLLALAGEALQCIEEWGPKGVEFGMLCSELPRIQRLLSAHLERCSHSKTRSRILCIRVDHEGD